MVWYDLQRNFHYEIKRRTKTKRAQTKVLNSTRLIRSANAVSVLRTLYAHGDLSRTRLAGLTKMSPATITRITAELTAKGLIAEVGREASQGGRKAILLHLNDRRICAGGLQILRDRVDLALADLRGEILVKRSFRPYSLEPPEMVREIAREFHLLLADSGTPGENVLGVGAAVTGIVDSAQGMLLRSTALGWRMVPVAGLLEEALGFPATVENDANAAALAEVWFGRGKDVSSLLFITTDRGVGMGIIQEGRLLGGARGMAGEIGHIPLSPDGHPCRCGQRGCLETYLFLPDVLRRYRELGGEETGDGGILFARARAGEPAATQVVEASARALGTVASFAAGLLDPDLIVIGGLWGRLAPDFLVQAGLYCREALAGGGLPSSAPLVGSGLGEDVDLRGAIGLVVNRWFTPPIAAAGPG